MSDDLDYLAERLSQILATGDVTGTERDFIEGIMENGWADILTEWDEEDDFDLRAQIRRAKQIIQNH